MNDKQINDGGLEIERQNADAGLDVEAVLRLFLTGDGFIAECDIPHIVAALTAQPAASTEHATCNLQLATQEPVACAFFTEKGEVAYTGIYDRTLKALERVKTTRMGISAGSIDLYAAPVAAQAEAAAGDARDREDAERYRLLRRKVRLAGGEFHILNLDPRYIAQDSAAELDAAIDAAMRAFVASKFGAEVPDEVRQP